jgi:protein-tyrosine phosphatase
MAEAVFRQLVQDAELNDQIDIESAGTGGWHIGDRPHRGTLKVLAENQIEVGAKRARQLRRTDSTDFDYIIAMDADNVADIETALGQRVPRLLEFAPPGTPHDVPDPYYANNFDEVYRLVQAGCQGLLAHIRAETGL